MLAGFFLGFLSAITAIHESHLHVLPSDFLHRIVQRLDLRSVAFIGRCHAQRQKMPQGVYGKVNLGALARLMNIDTSPMPALWCALPSAVIFDSRTWISGATRPELGSSGRE